MAAQGEARAPASSGCAADQERLGATLVAALELALLAAHRLLSELDSAAGRHAEAAAHLERALALAASGAAPDERALTLLTPAGSTAVVSEPAEVHERLVHRCAGPVLCHTQPALDRNESSEASSAGSTGAGSQCSAGLTRRELEVLRLIAAGKSNREIAATLYLSPRTAERHVANIYLKIGAHSKAEAAAYALRHSLA